MYVFFALDVDEPYARLSIELHVLVVIPVIGSNGLDSILIDLDSILIGLGAILSVYGRSKGSTSTL